jgi:predicted amidophosphoribosyltransferase
VHHFVRDNAFRPDLHNFLLENFSVFGDLSQSIDVCFACQNSVFQIFEVCTACHIASTGAACGAHAWSEVSAFHQVLLQVDCSQVVTHLLLEQVNLVLELMIGVLL